MPSPAPVRDAQPVVLIVDDDPLVRGALDSLFRSVDYAVRNYGSAQELLDAALPDSPCCLVVDVRMPHIGGFECRERLAERGVDLPVIFLTGHGDIPMSVKAMKAGAVDFLPKPFREQDLLDAVSTALERDRQRLGTEDRIQLVRARFGTLSPREREVMALVTAGKMNKQVAGDLGLSEITVKIHRGSAMRKMGVRTLADLVKLSEELRLAS